jgi:hypothetical protein
MRVILSRSLIYLMPTENSAKERTAMYVDDQIQKLLDAVGSEDCDIAIRAGHAMAERFQQDMAITQNLEVVKLSECREPPLEIIRFRRRVRYV